MNPQLIETPLEALTFIAIELIMLTVVLGLLTYLFLKIYPFIMKLLTDHYPEDFK